MPPSFVNEFGISLPTLLSKNQTGFSASSKNFLEKIKVSYLNAQETFLIVKNFFLSSGKNLLTPT